MKPTWQYKTAGVIWRVLPTETGKFIGEERRLDAKQASFFCVNQITGEVHWENVNPGGGWWIGIETIHRDVVFLHEFATPDMPARKGIHALDVLTGTHLWSNNNLTLLGAQDETVYATTEAFGSSLVHEIEYRSGAVLKSGAYRETATHAVRQRSSFELANSMEFPIPLQDSTLDIPAALVLKSHIPEEGLHAHVEALEQETLLIFNYYEHASQSDAEQPRLRNTLKLVDKRTGHELFREVLTSNATSPAPETFFVSNRMLYYVKERSMLTAVRLPYAHSH